MWRDAILGLASGFSGVNVFLLLLAEQTAARTLVCVFGLTPGNLNTDYRNFLPPPPPPTRDGTTLPSLGFFPPPPPAAPYEPQMKGPEKTLEERRSSLDAEIDSLTSILADLESSSPYKPQPAQVLTAQTANPFPGS
ncbi:unnamed protein product [Arctogadus glacialis]